MKAASAIFSILLICLTGRGLSQLLPFFSNLRFPNQPEPLHPPQSQSPFMATAPNIALPDSGTGSNDGSNNPSSSVLISDVVGRPHNINIFAGFTRDISAISSRLDSSSANSTILAPLNAEIYKLPRKPWEDPKEYERLGTQAYEGVGGEGRANENLKRFIEAHIVPESPWEEGRKVKTLAGRELWWERSKGGSKLIQPEGVEVENVADKVANGEVWILKGVLNYAS